MGNRDASAVKIPAGEVARARGDLGAHIRGIRGASAFLHRRGDYAPSILFAALCVEAAKHNVLSSCLLQGKVVTNGDMLALGSHRARIAAALHGMHDGPCPAPPGPAGTGRAEPACSAAAKRLDSMKQLAMYYEHRGGSPLTLEGVLGEAGVRKVSAHLQDVAFGAARATGTGGSVAPADQGRRPDRPTRGHDGRIAEITELAREVPLGRGDMADGAIPAGDLPTMLYGLETHVSGLDRLAVDLHNGRHPEASILMSVISFEEANKHYVVARCRRRGEGVTGRLMGDIRAHNPKLSVFFTDVANYTDRGLAGRGNVAKHAYAAVHPHAFLKLDGLKQFTTYFDHAIGSTMLTRAVFGDGTIAISNYLRRMLPGILSWAIMSDGDSDSPYARHNPNPVHLLRYRALEAFTGNPDNEWLAAYGYWAIGRIDLLNDAVRSQDAALCRSELAEIQRHLERRSR